MEMTAGTPPFSAILEERYRYRYYILRPRTPRRFNLSFLVLQKNWHFDSNCFFLVHTKNSNTVPEYRHRNSVCCLALTKSVIVHKTTVPYPYVVVTGMKRKQYI